MIGPSTFADRHYVPVLRVEKAELNALDEAERRGLSDCTPLFLLTPKHYADPPPVGRKRGPKRAANPAEIALRLSSLASRVSVWGNGSSPKPRRCFVEIGSFDAEHGGSHITEAFNQISCTGAVPVTTPDRTHHSEIAAIHARIGTGVAMRVDASHPVVWADVLSAVSRCGVAPDKVDLILDIGKVDRNKWRTLRVPLARELRTAATNQPWRSITLLGGSVEANAGKMVDKKIRRWDWLIWRSIRRALQKAGVRLPAFGDYGSLPPGFEVPDFPRSPQPYHRYASWRFWLTYKERSRGSGMRQGAYQKICKRLIRTPQYRRCGPLFSDSDAEFLKIARGTSKKKYGGGAFWIQQMTNHQLHFITRQLQVVP